MALHVLREGEAAGEADRLRVTVGRDPVDVRAAGVGQAEHAGDLVEGLARGVVDGLAEELDVVHQVAHEEERGVSAGDEQRDARGLERDTRPAVDAEEIRAHVSDEVVDAVQRDVEGHGERLRRADADHERAGEAGTRGDGDRVELAEGDARLGERRVDGGGERLEVRAGGDLGDDAAVARVLVHGAGDDVGEEGLPADDADARLVAGGLDAEDEGAGVGARGLVGVRLGVRGGGCGALGGRVPRLGDLGRRRGEGDAHHDGVHVVRLVVVRAHGDGLEAERGVQGLRDRVVGAHLEQDLAGAADVRFRDETGQEGAPDPPTAAPVGDGDGLHVGGVRAAGAGEARVAEDPAAVRVDGHDVPAVAGGQLAAHRIGRPGVGDERAGLEAHQRGQVGDLGGAEQDAHDVTRFGPAETVTSGERR